MYVYMYICMYVCMYVYIWGVVKTVGTADLHHAHCLGDWKDN